MINLISFLVQNVASDVICNDIPPSCPVSKIGNQHLMVFENSDSVSRIIHQLHSIPYLPYI